MSTKTETETVLAWLSVMQRSGGINPKFALATLKAAKAHIEKLQAALDAALASEAELVERIKGMIPKPRGR